MLPVHLKIAWRNMQKHRQFTILNLLGLSTGLACALFIYLWVQDELSIDSFHKNDKQLIDDAFVLAIFIRYNNGYGIGNFRNFFSHRFRLINRAWFHECLPSHRR